MYAAYTRYIIKSKIDLGSKNIRNFQKTCLLNFPQRKFFYMILWIYPLCYLRLQLKQNINDNINQS